MTIKWCDICGNIKWEYGHTCLPTWYIEDLDYLGDELKKIYAANSREAAEKYAQWLNGQGDYSIINGSTLEIKVYNNPEGENGTKFNVERISIPNYIATRIK